MQHMHHILDDGGHLVYAWFEAMHTRIDIMLWDSDAAYMTLLNVVEEAVDEVGRISVMGNCFSQESEVSRVNATPVGEPVKVSDELLGILLRCCDYNLETEGLFDITASVDLPGMMLSDKLGLAQNDGTVMRHYGQAKINLSGFLKGYALDKVVEKMRKNVRNGLVSFGNSSVFAFGNHPGGSGWAVAAADGSGRSYVLHDECLTTSGNDTETRKHIINPLTGELIEGKGMVSVLSSTAERGEVLSTVSFIRNNIETKTQKI